MLDVDRPLNILGARRSNLVARLNTSTDNVSQFNLAVSFHHELHDVHI